MIARAYHKIDTFVVSKHKWDKEEGTGNSMKNELYVHVQWYGKRHLLGWSDVEQQQKNYLFCGNFLKAFQVNLKACLD